MFKTQQKTALGAWLISILLVASCFAAKPNVAFTVQHSWTAVRPQPIFSLSTLVKSPIQWQYFEFGGVFMPNLRSNTVMVLDSVRYSRTFDHSFYGFIGGYFLTIAPIFRPGVLLGTILTTKQTFSSKDGSNYEVTSVTSPQIDYYAAFEIQSGIFTFCVSNKGIGGGLNIQF